MNKRLIIGIVAVAAGFAAVFIWNAVASTDTHDTDEQALHEEEVVIPEKQDRLVKVEVTEGSTYGVLMADAGVDPNVYMSIYDAASDVYDLAKVRIGRFLQLRYDKDSNEFIELMYPIDTEEELFVRRSVEEVTEVDDAGVETTREEVTWTAERVPIQYDVEIVTDSGVVESSMYQAAIDAGIDERAIIELANAFQWSVDFAMEVQKGDEFSFVYEKRYRDGEYVMPGQILAGKFVNKGVALYTFYFEESAENTGYFDEDANSVQKMFLKAPVEFRYISSGFTTGLRYVEAFNVSTGHRAIDYAAAYGTPVRAVGNGSVTFAGWDGPYGNKISIRHNGTYSTNYAHLSKFAVSAGERVNQGDIIGYVGSTGFSTGPHLHYEMVKDGVKINPLNEVLPPGTPIKDENKERFYNQINPLKEKLNQ